MWGVKDYCGSAVALVMDHKKFSYLCFPLSTIETRKKNHLNLFFIIIY